MALKRIKGLWRSYRAASQVMETLDEGRADWETRKASPAATRYASPAWWTRLLTAMRELALSAPLPTEAVEILTMKNWKTTLSGAAAILAVVSKIVATGQIDWQVDGPAILAGIGLIVAKDAEKAPAGK